MRELSHLIVAIENTNHARSTQIPPIVAFVEKTPGPTISEIVRLWRFATPARSSFLLVAVLCRIKAKGIDAQKAIPPWSILGGHLFLIGMPQVRWYVRGQELGRDQEARPANVFVEGVWRRSTRRHGSSLWPFGAKERGLAWRVRFHRENPGFAKHSKKHLVL